MTKQRHVDRLVLFNIKFSILRNLEESKKMKDLHILNTVAEVLSAETGPDGGPGVLLCPGQGTGGHGGDWVVLLAKLDTGRETFSI